MKLFGEIKRYTPEEVEQLKREEVERAYAFRERWKWLYSIARDCFGCGS
jgi:hypothetical protein